MNIILVDDDNAYLEELKNTVAMICKIGGIPAKITVTDDPFELTDDALWKKNDVILLDIDMPDVSGIEIASKINALKGMSEKPYIIFVTSRDGLVFDALKEQPYSFVRKSAIEDLAPCISKIEKRLNADDTYIVRTAGAVNKVLLREIAYLEKQGNYVIFHTASGELRERSTIDEKSRDLREHGFIRVHIGYLVNPIYIEKIDADSVTLTGGVRLSVSRGYRKTVKSDFFDWMVKNR